VLTDLVRGGDWRITRRNRAHPGRHRAPGATEPATAADQQAWPASSGQGQIAAGQRTRTGRALYDDLVAAELADGCRVVAADEHWIAFVPAAARWPFEVHVPPRVRVPVMPLTESPQRCSSKFPTSGGAEVSRLGPVLVGRRGR